MPRILYFMSTIVVTKNVREQLKKIGQKGQTYDDILKLLISVWNESK